MWPGILRSDDVLERLSWLFATRGVPEHIRSDNGPEFTAKVVRQWLARVGVKTLFIEPGSPWENGYVESFNGKLSDELLSGEIFYTLNEAKVLIERWRIHYNTVRPHSALGYRPPAPEARLIASRMGMGNKLVEGGMPEMGRGAGRPESSVRVGERVAPPWAGCDPPAHGVCFEWYWTNIEVGLNRGGRSDAPRSRRLVGP